MRFKPILAIFLLFFLVNIGFSDTGSFNITEITPTNPIYREYSINRKTTMEIFNTPYIDYNKNNIIFLRYYDYDRKVISNASVKFIFNGTEYNMSYNKNYDGYIIYVKPTEIGKYNVTIKASYEGYETQEKNITLISKNPFYVTISLYADKNGKTLYTDEFGFVILRSKDILCFNHEPCDFFAPYRKGVAVVKLYEPSKYEILFGHGTKQYNYYWEIPQEFFLRKLYKDDINGEKEINLYVPKYQFGLNDYSVIFDILNSSLIVSIGFSIFIFFIAFYLTMDLTISLVFSIFIFILINIIRWF